MVNCLSVKKADGERARELLLKYNLLDEKYKVKNVSDRVYFPVKAAFRLEELIKELPGAEISENVFDLKTKPRTLRLRDLLASSLSEYDRKIFPRSYDVIGDLMLIELKEELWADRFKIGAIIKENFTRIRGVFAKKGVVEGEFRVREIECIGGECNPVTIHVENGCKYHLDLTKVYFNNRLSSERRRVAEQVKPDENVIDMFAGVGPFTILIAKKGAKVNAIDVNPDAVFYLKKNIVENKVEGNAVAYLGRAEEIVEYYLTNKADRVIMNLPSASINYLNSACKSLKKRGGVVHLYFFSDVKELESKIKQTEEAVKTSMYKIKEQNIRRVREIAPFKYIYVLDLTLG
ncbi:MAG: class I SAM-dependent methyltransferase family protein [Candidatus Odinarchaeum yellowstonii]|uniref:Class I SAM-dependent methyltransferase family protein n=1 Tax=Odinarchaeota yellowstonii (strain LCB_4) TaxID=1841599 RepID=A0AAF0D354_ODILC|nr:MAG: class I SAM-dependent methyltransferase family protein [Candidatus Odinarchaeum yellowstonii]